MYHYFWPYPRVSFSSDLALLWPLKCLTFIGVSVSHQWIAEMPREGNNFFLSRLAIPLAWTTRSILIFKEAKEFSRLTKKKRLDDPKIPHRSFPAFHISQFWIRLCVKATPTFLKTWKIKSDLNLIYQLIFDPFVAQESNSIWQSCTIAIWRFSTIKVWSTPLLLLKTLETARVRLDGHLKRRMCFVVLWPFKIPTLQS